MHKRVFESFPELCLNVFKNEKVLPIIKRLLGMCGSGRNKDRCLLTHVIHNNAFRIRPGDRDQAPVWHTDDAPLFMTSNGKELPESVQIAPMVLTCMYYLNDVRGPIDGMTHIIPGSHRLGRPCTQEDAEKLPWIAPEVKEGTVLIISSSLWHRGASVSKEEGRDRYLFQVSYGRRLIGHKHGTIMNYLLPPQVEKLLITEEDRELMGFLEGGAYS